MQNNSLVPPLRSWSRSFTLIELIVVIIIVGILAAVGISQYSTTVEKSRLAEAKVRIGVMKQLAYEYWLNNGSVTGITNADVGVDYTCKSSDFYKYYAVEYMTGVGLAADRCTSGGKTPNASVFYRFVLIFYPATGAMDWRCGMDPDNHSCFGLPPT